MSKKIKTFGAAQKCANLEDSKIAMLQMCVYSLKLASIQPRTSPPKSGLPACLPATCLCRLRRPNKRTAEAPSRSAPAAETRGAPHLEGLINHEAIARGPFWIHPLPTKKRGVRSMENRAKISLFEQADDLRFCDVLK